MHQQEHPPTELGGLVGACAVEIDGCEEHEPGAVVAPVCADCGRRAWQWAAQRTIDAY